MSHTKGRKALPYTGSYEDLADLISYDPDTGEFSGISSYSTDGIISKDGHLVICLPVDVAHSSRGNRVTKYFRADHISWTLCTGEWPTGWMEHVNGLKTDCTLDNLVHCDPDGVRWWYGRQAPGLDRQMVVVDADGGYDAEGPITLRVMDGGRTAVKPQVNEAYRTATMRPVDTNDQHEEDITYERGEFGVDWGVEDEEENL